MTYSIANRSLTEEERKRVEALSTLNANHLAFMFISFLGFGFLGYLLGRIAGWVGEGTRLFSSNIAVRFVLTLGIVAGVAFSFLWGKRALALVALAKRELQKGEAEVIHVQDCRYFQQDERNDEGPTLYFDLGDRKLLALRGQWIFDEQIYGASRKAGDENDSEGPLNGLEAPYAFPSTEFTLHRLPTLGTVLKVEVQGRYLKPERTFSQRSGASMRVPNSQILDGTLEEIAARLSGQASGA